MLRALAIAVSGIVYFILSLLIFLPFRMKPVENYNLFALPVLAAIFLGLVYKVCTVEKESKGYLYAFYAGILMWQVVGEIPFIKVPAGHILQFSDLNIKMLGGYYYMLAGWVLLHILWRSGAIKKQVAFMFVIFLGIWSFELYMDNYSFRVPMQVMPMVSNVIMLFAVVVSIFLLVLARKAATIEKKTIIGGVLYISISLIMMASGQWKKPQDFYIKYESTGIENEIKELQEERQYIEEIKTTMGIQSYMTPNPWAR
ncbi:MAG: hypothetical protein NTV89_11375 [Proteobacteria bacterium]|nr:hypothetical protein [Pseudomonadota bacterium]